jgi:hypothetical protein
MAKRWLIGGLAVGVGALVLAPETRTWLRRRLGLEPEDRRWFEEEGVENAEHEGDEPLDTREARFSLRARLAEEGHAEPAQATPAAAVEPAPEPSAFPAFPSAPAEPSFPAFEQPAVAPLPAPEPVAEEPAAEEEQPAAEEPVAEEPAVEEPVAEEPAVEEPVAEEPAAEEPVTWAPWEPAAQAAPESEPEPEPAPRPMWPSAAPDLPPAPATFDQPILEPDPGYISYEALPAITPEADEPRAPGEDTNEIEPLPSSRAEQAAAEEDEEETPPPPPTMLRPPTSPAPRPFSSEGSSFRSAIDAARERVHGAAREATPDDEGENTEPIDDRS